MNKQPDDQLRSLFQAQRHRESEHVPTFEAISAAGERRVHAAVFSFRLALAASVMVCLGLTLAGRLWFVSTQSDPTMEWAALSEWSPVTDNLLEFVPTSLNDATLHTDEWILDETYTEIHNEQEML